MRRARTKLGERLTQAAGGPCVGQVWKLRFQEREVACPTCGAPPHRRCQAVPDDRYVVMRGKVPTWKQGLRAGGRHYARFERAQLLSSYARRHALDELAYRPPRARPPRPPQDTSPLPLFALAETP